MGKIETEADALAAIAEALNRIGEALERWVNLESSKENQSMRERVRERSQA